MRNKKCFRRKYERLHEKRKRWHTRERSKKKAQTDDIWKRKSKFAVISFIVHLENHQWHVRAYFLAFNLAFLLNHLFNSPGFQEPTEKMLKSKEIKRHFFLLKHPTPWFISDFYLLIMSIKGQSIENFGLIEQFIEKPQL